MIGIYGGTFDPVHFGHLRTALEVKEALELEQVRFIPCRLPPHRNPPFFSPEQRLNFLQTATADEPGFVVDTRELDRPGPSYMVETLESLRQDLGETPICLILGLDAFLGLPGWHHWESLFELAHLVVMDRPGYRPEWKNPLRSHVTQRTESQALSLHEIAAGKIFFQPVTHLEISGTQIRQCLKQGRSPRFLMPDKVLLLMYHLT